MKTQCDPLNRAIRILGWGIGVVLFLTMEAAYASGWRQIDISGTQLEEASIQVLGSVGVTARCHPNGIDHVPNFSNSARSHLCQGRPTVRSGSRTQILEVRERNGRYALKLRVTSSSRSGQSGYAQEGDEQWVYLNPRRPFLQIFNDRTGSVHNLGDYLRAARNGEEIEIPGFEEPERLDAAAEGELEEGAGEVDDPGAAPSDPDVVSSVEEMEPADEFQSAPPGVHVDVPDAIEEPELATEGGNAVSNFCQTPVEDERVNDTTCPDRPSQRINGRWRTCPDRTPSNIRRHGGALPFSTWLTDLVNTASGEVSNAPSGSGSSCASPALMMSLLDQESTFHPMAGGNQWGDHGIAQFQLGTAESTVRYLRSVAAADSPMRDTINKPGGLRWVPPGCSATSTPWRRNLSPECFQSIQENCVENGRLVASLYCPQFAIRLQGYHIKQICEEEVMMDGVNVTQVLQGNGDPIAQARFIVSRYNRGYRIYNSAAHHYAQHGRFPTSHEYGDLWSVRRPTAYARRSADPFPGGNLLGHTINRCYNWRISGLCGGIRGTIFHHYLNVTCDATRRNDGVGGTTGTGVAE